MAVFENTSVLLDLKNLSYKEKKKLKSAVTENGGSVSFVVNKQCTLIVTSDVSNLSYNRLRSIHKHQTPVVGVDYIYTCLHRGGLLPVDEFKLDTSPPAASSPPLPLSSLRPAPLSHHVPVITAAVERPRGKSKPVSLTPSAESPERSTNVLDKFRIYTETDSDLPSYPNDFQVAKYSIFEKINSNTWCVLELQSFKGRQYRVVRCWRNDVEVKKELVFLSTSEDAVDVYQALRETWQAAGLQPRRSIPPQSRDLGSFPLQQLLLEEKLNTGSVSQEVAVFVELLWTEALGRLNVLLVPSIDKISLNDVSRAEGLLLQAQRKLKEGNYSEMSPLMQEFSTLLPNRLPPVLLNAKDVSQKLDFCQLIRDVLSVSEMSLRGAAPSSLGKYRALRCSVETVPPGSSEFQAVTSVLRDSKLQILQILRVGRGVELEKFKNELGNVNMLLHSSSPSNFVGILSRGLLLPHTGVEHHGIERTDVGNLGSGIYFSDAVSTALKYSRPSEADGSRLLLVCDVALGRCRDVHKRDVTLTQAPEGHHSVHGVRCTPDTHSEFEDDEYVVYSPDQVKLKYVVQFSIEGEALREFSPAVDTSAEPCPPPSLQVLSSEDVGVEDIKNPLDEVKAGLLDSSGQQLPLQAVHVKCKLMDLLSQVIIFQKYTNTSSVSIEAKYVFPLDDSAAVCGFEAFINGKHVVGKVKEKETARKEYKQAIEKGHGAYLMDQDAPDVFTISVGNLPPGATVLIKVTFVSELIIKDGSILFSLPGSVAPWQESAALNQTTQVTVEKVCVTDDAANTREFSLDVSVEMPNDISSLQCITHKVKVKRTDCKAVVSVLPGQVMGLEGFQLSVSLSEVHLPRMWVERHPDKDSEACMLVFYPDFDVSSRSESDEVVLLLDTSESMKGESLLMAQRIALQVLKALGSNVRLNVILFGTDHTEAFLTAQPLTEARQAAESFIKNLSPVGGSTELWRPLRALSLLPPSRGIRNLLLLSDGHIQNADFTLKLLRDNVQHSRLFTCGLSPTANRHMLRALAQAGGGAYEFFDTKVKHNWSEKVSRQVKRVESPGCSSVSVKWQQFNPTAPSPVQAPKQLHALFNDCHTLVYGFVPHCTQATLHGNLSGQELNTMVSTSELQKTRGTFLHKLTARALIRDHEDGSLDTDEAEHEGKKAELKSFIIELSKEFSILSQFTSFVAIEERDPEEPEEGFTDIPKLIAEEDVDFLPYISWDVSQDDDGDYEEEWGESFELENDDDMSEFYTEVSNVLCRGVRGDSLSLTDSSSSSGLLTDGMREIHSEQDEEDLDLDFEDDSALTSSSLWQCASKAISIQTSLIPPPPPPVGAPAPAPSFPWQTSSSTQGSTKDYLIPVLLHPSSLFHRQSCSFKRRSVEHSPIMMERKSLREKRSPCYDQFSSECSKPSHSISHASGASGWSPVFKMSQLESPQETESLLTETESSDHIVALEQTKPLSKSRVIQQSLDSVPDRLSQIKSSFGSARLSARRSGRIQREPAPCRSSEMRLYGSRSPTGGATVLSVMQLKVGGETDMEPGFMSSQLCVQGMSTDPDPMMSRWAKIFQMQHSEGYWELTTELYQYMNVNIDRFVNVFLKDKGICSLGVRAHTDILRLVATLLVLQMMREEKLEEGKLLRTLFCLDDSAQPRPQRWEEVKKAVEWVRWADTQYPCIYSRLEFGRSWESSTRQLLGYEGLPPFSPLRGQIPPLLVR